MSEKVTIPAAIVIVFLFWYFFLGGNAFIKTSVGHTNTLVQGEKKANNQKVISIFDLANIRVQERVNNPVLLSIVEESRKNGFSFENDGTILFTINKVTLKSIRQPCVEVPLKDSILDQIKIDKDALAFLKIEYFYSKEKGKNVLRFTADSERYRGIVQLNYRTGEKIMTDVIFYPPG